MTQSLDKAIEAARQQPPEVQEEIAEMISSAIKDAQWDALLASERSQRWLTEQEAGG